jgi:exopolysaccharide biosynthesis polyprenyl glycosylphosphotransferase
MARSSADLAGPRISVNPVAGLPLLHVDEPHLTRTTRFLKRAVESIGAFAALVVLSPVLLVCALAIKLTSPGPVLFKQERVGLDGQTFKMWKFRSMVKNAEALLPEVADLNEHDGVLFKIADDPRVTKVGKVLRRLSLDELPQLAHVVTGNMALVGPRPPLPSEVERYDDVVRRRLLVRPGLTGLWQVSGRSDLSWQESVRLDVYYVDNWSMTLDAVIVMKTISAVVRSRGAY